MTSSRDLLFLTTKQKFDLQSILSENDIPALTEK